MTPARRLQLEREADAICGDGSRVLFEMLAEFIDRHPDLGERVTAYADLDRSLLHLLGADRFPPRLFIVGGDRR
jgi:hypothetical protein